MNKRGFSLVEILVALITIGVIVSVMSPVITKKLQKKDVVIRDSISTNCTEKFGIDCKLCYKDNCITCLKNCADNEYKNHEQCICETCTDRSVGCIKCDKNNCLRCESGYGLDSGVCTLCTAGYYSDGLFSCKASPVGNYVATDGSSTYTPCEIGKYQDVVGQSSCKDCIAGTYQLAQGQSTCLDCEAGYYCTGGTHKAQCNAGQYSLSKASSCSTCPNGQWSNAGSSSCYPCPAGNTCVDGVKTQCIAGQYAQEGSTSCINCSSGTFSDAGSGYCIGCPPNSVCSGGTKVDCRDDQYVTNGACVNCTVNWEHCVACSTEGCAACESGYTLNEGACKADRFEYTCNPTSMCSEENNEFKQKITITSSGTFTPHSNQDVTMFILGGGYGGSAYDGDWNNCCRGGNGGTSKTQTVSLTRGTSYSVIVGVGGAGSTGANNAGTASQFGTITSAGGTAGGTGASGNGATGGNGVVFDGIYYAGGGGGAFGLGSVYRGGGNGASHSAGTVIGFAGHANTGGGGGSGYYNHWDYSCGCIKCPGGAGGSGIIILLITK